MSMTLSRYLDLTGDESLTADKPIVLNKQRMIRQYTEYMLDRTVEMFEYKGLPDTIPAMALERMLQTIGYIVVARVPEKPKGFGVEFESCRDDTDLENPIYALYGTFAEAPDPYMCPISITVANPGFTPSLSRTYEINKDCVVIRNDMSMLGLLPLHLRYASELTEGTISLRSAMINLREQTVIVARSQTAYESSLEYLRKKEAGEIGAIFDQPILGETDVKDSTGRANGVIQTIEGIQYLKASWFNELGLNQAFNMKREYLSSEEIAANNDILLPLVDDMLRCREIGVKLVNDMFGTNITVEKNSAWDNKQVEKDIGLNILQNEANGGNSVVTTQNGEEEKKDGDKAS